MRKKGKNLHTVRSWEYTKLEFNLLPPAGRPRFINVQPAVRSIAFNAKMI